MNTFSRRTFLKGLLSSTVALNVPIEIIERATKAIEALPDTPITLRNPTCYLKINDSFIPVGSIIISQYFGETNDFYGIKPDGKRGHIAYQSRPDKDEIDLSFSTDKRYFADLHHKVKFEIVNDILPKIVGYGHFIEHSFVGGPILDGEFQEGFLYNYTISGQLET